MAEKHGVLAYDYDEVGRAHFGVELKMGSYWPAWDEPDGLRRIVNIIRNQVYMDKWIGLYR